MVGTLKCFIRVVDATSSSSSCHQESTTITCRHVIYYIYIQDCAVTNWCGFEYCILVVVCLCCYMHSLLLESMVFLMALMHSSVIFSLSRIPCTNLQN